MAGRRSRRGEFGRVTCPRCGAVLGLPLLGARVKGSFLAASLLSARCQAEAAPSQGRRESHTEVKSHMRPRAPELGKESPP